MASPMREDRSNGCMMKEEEEEKENAGDCSNIRQSALLNVPFFVWRPLRL